MYKLHNSCIVFFGLFVFFCNLRIFVFLHILYYTCRSLTRVGLLLMRANIQKMFLRARTWKVFLRVRRPPARRRSALARRRISSVWSQKGPSSRCAHKGMSAGCSRTGSSSGFRSVAYVYQCIFFEVALFILISIHGTFSLVVVLSHQ